MPNEAGQEGRQGEESGRDGQLECDFERRRLQADFDASHADLLHVVVGHRPRRRLRCASGLLDLSRVLPL